MYLSMVIATVKKTLQVRLMWDKPSKMEYRVKKMSVVKFRVTGASITLLTRKAVSARQRHESREGKIAFVFLRKTLIGFNTFV